MLRPLVSLLLVATMVGGCAGAPERAPLPPELIRAAAIPGIRDARYWGDASPAVAVRVLDARTDAELAAEFEGIYAKPHSYLAISGGGANGAYGAGLAHIPAEFTEQAAEDFDPVYMGKLCAHAYEAAKNGYRWRSAPPGFANH